jgi:PQQ-like domain
MDPPRSSRRRFSRDLAEGFALGFVLLGGCRERSAFAGAAYARGALAEGPGPRAYVPEVRFRFHAGAPLLAAAGVGPEGNSCVGTADGYVHALGPNGAFRWSYTVHGAVIQPPVIAPSGLHFVATGENLIHAFRASGALFWTFRAQVAFTGPAALGADEKLYFVGSDQHLYAVTTRAMVAGRIAVGELTAGPVAGPDGGIWMANRRGQVLRLRGAELKRFQLGSPVRGGPAFGDRFSVWLAGDEMLALSPVGTVRFRRRGVFDIAGPNSAITPEGDGLWLDDAGELRTRCAGVGPPCASPSADNAGSILVPLETGEIGVLSARDRLRVRVGSSPLFRPVWSDRTRSAIVSTREGVVAAVATLPEPPAPAGR